VVTVKTVVLGGSVGFEGWMVKVYVPFRAGCPNAPETVMRLEFEGLVSLQPSGGVFPEQSPGLRIPWNGAGGGAGVWIVTVDVVPELDIESNWGIVASPVTAPKLLHNDLGAPKECPKSK